MEFFKRTKSGNLREITLFGLKFCYTKKPKLPPHIDKQKILPLIANFDGIGINADKRSPKLIVSLTSFPERMYEIHYTLYSLLTQTLKPDEVVLWLAKEQFPNGEADIPPAVLQLQKNGLTIKWCEDLRSYKKLIPSLKEYPDDIIVIVDDDVYYPADWLDKMYRQYLKTPGCVIGHRSHRIRLGADGHPLPYKQWQKNTTQPKPSFRNFLTGCGGVLYPPHSLYKDVGDAELFRKIAPYADDIWFWAMTVLNNVKVRSFRGRMRKVLLVNPERELRNTEQLTLTQLNIAQDGNNKQMAAVIAHYPQLLEKLKED